MARFRDTRFEGLTKYKGGQRHPHIDYVWVNREQLLMMMDQTNLVLAEIMKWNELFDIRQDAKGLNFILERWDEFFEFLKINATTNPQTLDEVEDLIPKYIEVQEMLLDKERQSRTEPNTFTGDQSETKV